MEILEFSQFIKINKSEIVCVIGQFDGFHLAHMALIEKAKNIAKEKNLKTALFTFDPHPDFILNKNKEHTYLTPSIFKAEVLSKCNFDYMVIIKFNEQVAKTLAFDFIEKYLLRANVKDVVVGFDFHFGYRGEGCAYNMQKLSNDKLKVHIIDEIKYDDEKLGSTKIKSLLKEGKVEIVAKLLNRPYHIEGRVVNGRKIGRTINLPTANIALRDDFVLVKEGVYGVLVTFSNQKYLGLANFGHNPSFNFRKEAILEVHLLDFSGDLYGEYLEIDFLSFIRPEKVFANKDEFLMQIKKDIEKVRSLKY